MYSKIIKNIIFPIYQMKLEHEERYITHVNLLDKTQWWSSSELEKLQFKRLKKLLKHADENVPFYHKIFKKLNFKPEYISSVKDLNKLPILTKDIVNKNFDELYARNYPKEKFILSSTGGSTAAPMNFYIDRRWEACNMAAAHRSWSWAGYEFGDKIAYLWSAHQDLKDSSSIDKIRNYLFRTIMLDAFDLTKEKMNKYLDILNKFRPKIINTYASTMFTFSQYITEMGRNPIKPKAILTTADMLYDYKRKSIEQAFNCDVFDYYSGRDTTLQAAECSEHFGYHMSIENAVVEFMKENEHVAIGETGNLIITDLCDYAMPFIRYEIGDLGTPSDEKCPCGRNLPIMKSLVGRTYDYILAQDGRLLSGIFFHSILVYYKIQGIKEFQIIQKTKNKIIMNIVKNENEKTEDIDRFITLIRKNIGEKIEIELNYVSSIERTRTGKLRHVISNLNKSELTTGKYEAGDLE